MKADGGVVHAFLQNFLRQAAEPEAENLKPCGANPKHEAYATDPETPIPLN